MKKILIVDDDIGLVMTMSTRLNQAGYITTTTTDGVEALDALKEEKFDLIILDILMPNLDGSSFLAILRSRNDTNNVPIIVLSGKSDNDIKETCKDLGVQTYLVKPYDPVILTSEVNSILKKKG